MWTMMEIKRQVPIDPLITFRILFGVLMLFSCIRFWLNGWISSLYVKPKFYFTYMGFDWVHPLGNTGMHLLFLLMGISALLVTLGLWYRTAIILFFISFSYIELIDVTNYLNHYYFVSIMSFLLIFLPAGRSFSLDIYFHPERKRTHVPLWVVGILRLQLGMVYFFAGLAKLNADWMLYAIPMKIWLPAKSHLPLIGNLMYQEWVAYLFSWFGAIYDLFIVFFLIQKRTRPYAYIAVLVFHFSTALFFPSIGMFPYVMILSSLIFFSGNWHRRLFAYFDWGFASAKKESLQVYSPAAGKAFAYFLGIYFLLQMLIPFRFVLYPGPLFWYEEGYRFSWRVMLMEKSGNTFFYVKASDTGRVYEVNNAEFLTPQQEKMMSTQPDMIIRYAHYLKTVYQQRGIVKPKIYAEGFVALNGARSQPFINPQTDLSAEELSWKHQKWILPFSKKP